LKNDFKKCLNVSVLCSNVKLLIFITSRDLFTEYFAFNAYVLQNNATRF